MNAFKKFLTNKNTVTIVGVLLIIVIIYVGYNFRINQVTKPEPIPVAKKTIQPRTLITEKMVEIVMVPPALIKGNIITSTAAIFGFYSQYNTMIPKGSMFYTDAVVSAKDLPDEAIVSVDKGLTVFNFPVNIETSYGNSIFPGNYIDIYFKALDDQGKIMVGKLVERVKVLAVKDRNGKHVFENSEEDRVSSTIIFAVPEKIHLLLRKAQYLEEEYDAETFPVPSNVTTEVGDVKITSQLLEEYINARTAYVPEETTTTETQTEGN